MNQVFIGILGTIILAGISLQANAQPFGIPSGTSIELLNVDAKPDVPLAKHWLALSSVPKPHSDFETYITFASPIVGVCSVAGISKTYKGDNSGTQVRSVFDKIESQLNAKYGEFSETKTISDDAQWAGENEWVKSIQENERVHYSSWGAAFGSNLTDNIFRIQLIVGGRDAATSQLYLQYTYRNFIDCDEELKNPESQDEDAL